MVGIKKCTRVGEACGSGLFGSPTGEPDQPYHRGIGDNKLPAEPGWFFRSIGASGIPRTIDGTVVGGVAIANLAF